jgi:putative dehydrogenase
MGLVVGVVGLGIMGGAIARSLVTAGLQVVGFDTDPQRQAELASYGIKPATSMAELASLTSVIITSLPSASAVHSTILAVAAATDKKVVIEASTLSLEDKLRARDVLHGGGHIALDCPISGTGAQAETRDLVIYASGDSASIAALEPLFTTFARQTYDVGDFGNGTRMKLVANLLVAIHNVATAEAMMLASKAGLDLKLVVELISSGAGTSRVFEQRAPLMANDCYEPATMKLSVWQKDLAIISKFAETIGCPTPLLNATIPLYATATAKGEHRDTASVFTVFEQVPGNAQASRSTKNEIPTHSTNRAQL